ncbi:progranulin-like [Betta splendens]|uniref:Progranulin-like n=1 Tax=Betta splendens TaxID=158456 RepID=A0A6P7P0A6_BETSP|nr:progranulin-like [Betta splendens]
MQGVTLWLLVGVCVWDFTACSIACHDGSSCPDNNTCCLTESGYKCCPYPDAVCCSDLAHCCPAGYRCVLTTKTCERVNQPWIKMPMVKKMSAEPNKPVLPESPQITQEVERHTDSDEKASPLVFCDNYHACPDGTTCCRSPQGFWFCCPYSPAWCCVGGSRCCPLGYDCDITQTHCVKQNLRFPFTPKLSLSAFPASRISALEDERLKETPMTALTEASDGPFGVGVIRCDSSFYCQAGQTCCKTVAGQWSCCPYPLGMCCKDGVHCCQYGYTCGPSSLTCRSRYSQLPSGKKQDAKTDF